MLLSPFKKRETQLFICDVKATLRGFLLFFKLTTKFNPLKLQRIKVHLQIKCSKLNVPSAQSSTRENNWEREGGRPTGLAREAAGGFCSGHTGQSLHPEAQAELKTVFK